MKGAMRSRPQSVKGEGGMSEDRQSEFNGCQMAAAHVKHMEKYQ